MGRRLIKLPLFIVLSLAAVLPAFAVQAPQPFTAKYDLERSGVTAGEVVLSFEQIGDNRYRYRRQSRTTGLMAIVSPQSIDEFSVLEQVDGQLRPVFYTYLRQGRKSRNVRINFDWKQLQATNIIDGDHWKMSIPAGTWDKLSVELALVHDLNSDGKPQKYPVADGGKLKQYRFDGLGEQTLDTPAGSFQTLIIKRRRNADSPRSTTLYMAKELRHLPVTIIHEKDGEGAGHAVLKRFDRR